MSFSKRSCCAIARASVILAMASFSEDSLAAGKKKPKKIPADTADTTASTTAPGTSPPAPPAATTPTPAANPTPTAADAPTASAVDSAATVTAPPDAPGLPPKCEGDDCPGVEHWDLASVFGIRLALMSAGRPATKTTFGAMFWGSSEYYRTDRYFALRSSGLAGLGGGSGGLEGGLGATLAVGIRVPVAAHHGPVVRIGLGGELQGNSQFYYSHIDLPIGELGYQFMSGNTIFEIGGRGAALITGRYNTGDTFHRELGTSGEFGGYIAAHAIFGRIDASFVHIPDGNNSPGTAVDVLRGTACAYASKLIALCLDGMYLRGDEQPALVPANATVPVAAYPATSTFYGGVMAGFSLH